MKKTLSSLALIGACLMAGNVVAQDAPPLTAAEQAQADNCVKYFPFCDFVPGQAPKPTPALDTPSTGTVATGEDGTEGWTLPLEPGDYIPAEEAGSAGGSQNCTFVGYIICSNEPVKELTPEEQAANCVTYFPFCSGAPSATPAEMAEGQLEPGDYLPAPDEPVVGALTPEEQAANCVKYFPFCSGTPAAPPADTSSTGEASAADIAAVAAANGTDMLTGDAASACEAILCLSTGNPPGECMPSLTRYFSIKFKSWTKTLNARKAFLALCPISSESNMPELLEALSTGSGKCDIDSLNKTPASYSQPGIISSLPSECDAYYSNDILASEKPMYVGTSTDSGYWVAADEYAEALARYNAGVRLPIADTPILIPSNGDR